MNERVKVPIRVKPSPDTAEEKSVAQEPAVAETEPPVAEAEPLVADEESAGAAPAPPSSTAAPEPEGEEPEAPEEDVEVWRDRALRLQAEIENFRKRQRRLAKERIAADRGRLLLKFLTVADDLERALDGDSRDADNLREGVGMTYRSLMQTLRQEGVEQIEAEGEPFDPLWHEAVGTVSHEHAGVEPDIVVEVSQSGYRLDGRLLRPARVIVAT